MSAGRCRDCGVTIWWAITHTGKRMPVDPEPVDHGNVYLVRGGPDLVAVVLSKDEIEAADGQTALYVSHFATCRGRQVKKPKQRVRSR